jgi:hypothetical protein
MVEIQYVMEFKHDAELYALRLAIPSAITLRHGTPSQQSQHTKAL